MPKAVNISALEANDITELPSDTVLISINPIDDLFDLKLDRKSNKILTVQFSDITCKCHSYSRPLDRETTLKILDFININKDKNFIVHCQAGVSRSAAVCLYLNIQHGHELKTTFWQTSNPNKYVLGSLFFYRNEKTLSGL